MANEEHLAKLKEGVKAWNVWRENNPNVRPDLVGADLRGANLVEADLHGASLGEANLFRANLNQANLRSADLRRANLSVTSLSLADLRDADLSQASLGGADLTWAILHGAECQGADLKLANLFGAGLRGADLTGAWLGYSIFGDNDLSTTEGLDAVRHHYPSTVGIDTLHRSQGKIPPAFLRGCGVPENFITYMSFLTGQAIEFYSCFISYSTKDQEFADRLYADLQNKGVRCWFAPHDVQGGKKLHEQIDDAIRVHERLLLILSPNSMNSGWVETEIRNARRRELAEKKRVLFPVGLTSFDALRNWKLFNADEGRDLATEIREFYIPDFSKWKDHDAYKTEFEKLMRDLRVEPEKSTLRM